MLEDEGNFNAPGLARLRSTKINELDQFSRHHSPDKQVGQVIVAGQDWIAGSGSPIKQSLRQKLAVIETRFKQVLEQGTLYIFHPPSLSGLVGHWLSRWKKYSRASRPTPKVCIYVIDSPPPTQHNNSGMTKLNDLTTAQLQRAIEIKEQIEQLQSQIDSIATGGGEIPIPLTEDVQTPAKRKYHMTAAHKQKLIKALARARAIRSANLKGTAAKADKPAKKDRRSSPATRAKISAAAKERWAKARLEGKKGL
jgi:hypothetical protein